MITYTVGMKYVFIMLCGFALSGCGQSSRQETQYPSQLLMSKIIGGTEVRSEDLFSTRTVVVYNKKISMICTGAIIGQELILTAAHCLRKAKVKDIEVGFGMRLNGDQTLKYTVKKATMHAGFIENPSDIRNDLALIQLGQNIPSPYEALDLEQSRHLRLEKGQVVTSMGYGIIRNGFLATGAGTLRRAELTVESYDVIQEKIVLDQRKGKGLCFGDSGGPTFSLVDQRPVLVGITSYVTGPAGIKPRNYTCLETSVLANPNYFYDWINETKLKWQSQ